MAETREKAPSESDPEMDFSGLNEILEAEDEAPANVRDGASRKTLRPWPAQRGVQSARWPRSVRTPGATTTTTLSATRDRWLCESESSLDSDPLNSDDGLFHPKPTPALGTRADVRGMPPRVPTSKGMPAANAPTMGPEPEFLFTLEGTPAAGMPQVKPPPPLPRSSGDAGDAYSLVESAGRPRLAAVLRDPLGEMNNRFALGDYSGALVLAET